MRTKSILVRLTPEEKERLTKTAQEHGIPIADLIRFCTLKDGGVRNLPSRDLYVRLLHEISKTQGQIDRLSRDLGKCAEGADIEIELNRIFADFTQTRVEILERLQ